MESETQTVTPAEWLGELGLDEADVQTLSKYGSLEEGLKGGANAMRMVGKSVRFPDETTDEDDKQKFHDRLNTYLGIPANADGYTIVPPKDLPEGMSWDEDLGKWFKQAAADAKLPANSVSAFVEAYSKRQIEQHNAYQQFAKKAEEELRGEWGDQFETKVGVAGDPERIGTIKQAAMQLSKELGMDYTDEQGHPQSHLIDCLELSRKNGPLGDKVAILKVFDWIHKNHFAEGKTIVGETPPAPKGKNFFDYEDMDEASEVGSFGMQ